MPIVIRFLIGPLLALVCAGPAWAADQAGLLMLAQAGSALEEFDEIEGLRALGEPPATARPANQPDESDDAEQEVVGADEPAAVEAPAPPRSARNPSPGDGFDELVGLKSLGQDWRDLARSLPEDQAAGPGDEDEAAAPSVAAEPAATPEAAAAPSSPEPAGPDGEDVAAAADAEPSLELLEEEIEQLFDPQPLDEPGMVLGALPEPGPESDGGAEQPPSYSAVPKEEQERILTQLEALNPVVATVGEEEIYWTDVTNTAKRLPERYQSRFETVFPVLLQRIVDLKLLAIAGRRLGLDQEDDFRARIAAYEERLVSQDYLRRQLNNEVTPEALKKRYDEIVQNRAARTQIRARHILLKTEDEAREVIAELEQGADFVELAKARSVGASAANGGSLGRFSVDRMVPAFSAAALALSPGEYTKDPVLTQFGWHVILLEEGADQTIPDYAELEPELRRDVGEQAVERLLRDLRTAAQIEFFPDPALAAGSETFAPAEDEATALE